MDAEAARATEDNPEAQGLNPGEPGQPSAPRGPLNNLDRLVNWYIKCSSVMYFYIIFFVNYIYSRSFTTWQWCFGSFLYTE
jgi:hypothetical protein